MDTLPPNEPARLAALRPRLEARHTILRALRDWFDVRGFLEVETPVRVATPALERHIDAEPAGGAWLRTSPEFHLKRLLAAGYERIYQIGPCFRRGEQGPKHHPEFTMLEWYRAGATAADILQDTIELLRSAGRQASPRPPLDLEGPWRICSVSEAFRIYAGWDPVTAWDADRFDLDLVERVEPALAGKVPAVLTDYPAPAAAFSRRNPANPAVAERWELYLNGIEIANAYTELTDPDEQEARYIADAEDRRRRGKPVYPRDEAFLSALRQGLPPCAGIALGVDRLVMALTGAPALDEVMAFRDGNDS